MGAISEIILSLNSGIRKARRRKHFGRTNERDKKNQETKAGFVTEFWKPKSKKKKIIRSDELLVLPRSLLFMRMGRRCPHKTIEERSMESGKLPCGGTSTHEKERPMAPGPRVPPPPPPPPQQQQPPRQGNPPPLAGGQTGGSAFQPVGTHQHK